MHSTISFALSSRYLLATCTRSCLSSLNITSTLLLHPSSVTRFTLRTKPHSLHHRATTYSRTTLATPKLMESKPLSHTLTKLHSQANHAVQPSLSTASAYRALSIINRPLPGATSAAKTTPYIMHNINSGYFETVRSQNCPNISPGLQYSPLFSQSLKCLTKVLHSSSVHFVLRPSLCVTAFICASFSNYMHNEYYRHSCISVAKEAARKPGSHHPLQVQPE